MLFSGTQGRRSEKSNVGLADSTKLRGKCRRCGEDSRQDKELHGPLYLSFDRIFTVQFNDESSQSFRSESLNRIVIRLFSVHADKIQDASTRSLKERKQTISSITHHHHATTVNHKEAAIRAINRIKRSKVAFALTVTYRFTFLRSFDLGLTFTTMTRKRKMTTIDKPSSVKKLNDSTQNRRLAIRNSRWRWRSQERHFNIGGRPGLGRVYDVFFDDVRSFRLT